MSATCITVNAPQVIHEAIDGEVIVINLGTGTYYSLKGSAAEIWQLIQEPGGASDGEVADALAARYEAARPTLEDWLERFLAELTEEGLVSRAEAADARGGTGAVDSASANGQPVGKPILTPPLLEKFTDMQDLVLLDPVHEVDETGWPQRADAAAGVVEA